MITLIHVVLAISALSLSVVANFKPSETKLKISYSLATGTLITGVMLIFLTGASVVRTCLTGITFFAVVTVLNELTRKRLSAVETDR